MAIFRLGVFNEEAETGELGRAQLVRVAQTVVDVERGGRGANDETVVDVEGEGGPGRRLGRDWADDVQGRRSRGFSCEAHHLLVAYQC